MTKSYYSYDYNRKDMIMVKNIFITMQVVSNVHYVNLDTVTKDLNPKLEEFIGNKGDEMKRKTNVIADMTNYQTVCEPFEELHKIIMPYVGQFFCLQAEKPDTEIFLPEFFETWGAIYRKGDYTDKHVHEPSKLSWIYYVKASSQSAPLHLHQIINEKGKKETFKIPPKTSDLVIFPSWTPHSVPTQESDEERICVAGNVNLPLDKDKSQMYYDMFKK